MNILFLIFSFNIGGIERLLIDMANNMTKRGNSITLCIINDDYDNELISCLDPDVDVIKLGRQVGNKNMFPQMIKLTKIIKTKGVDILHCQGINCVIFSCPNIKIFNTVHDVGNYPSYSWFKIWLQNLILDKTIAISYVVESEILKKAKDHNKVVTIYNAVNIEKFDISDKTFDEHDVRIGNVARFYPEKKGQDILVNAVKEIKKTMKGSIICEFAGAVFKGQEKTFDEIKKLVIANDLEENIVFLGGVSDIPGFLRKTDIFVLPSRYEGFGISLIEALASGVPVVASDIDGPKEIFELAEKDNVDIGYLAEVNSIDDFSKKIRDCIEHYDKYNRYELQSFVKKHFSVEEMVSKHLEVYNSEISKQKLI